MKKRKTTAIIVSMLVIVIAIVAFVFVYNSKKEDETSKEEVKAETFEEVTYKGREYTYNTDIQTIAFLGVDSREKVEMNGTPGWNGQSDTILVAVLDTAHDTGKILQIPRESMVRLELYDMHGEFFSHENAQIALQYAYGDGGVTSCVLATDRISEILNDIPISYYLSLNLDGISVITEAIGGIDIVIPEDYTDVDPSYTKGAKVTLKGDSAEHYLRYRDTDVTGSNIPRMKRQDQVLQALMKQLPKKAEKDSNMYIKLFKEADPYMTTNLKIDNIESLQEYKFDDEIITVPGDMKEGEYHDEFYIDNEQLMSIIINLFYIEK